MDVYKRHDVANMTLPSITIEASEHEPIFGDNGNWSSDLLVNHRVVCTVRVHTGQVGGPLDRANTTLYLDQIVEVSKKNVNNGLYRIMSFEVTAFNATFEESATTGGEIELTLNTLKVYGQA